MPLEHHPFERGTKIGKLEWNRMGERKGCGQKLAALNCDVGKEKQRTSKAEIGGVGLKNLATVDVGGRVKKAQPSWKSRSRPRPTPC